MSSFKQWWANIKYAHHFSGNLEYEIAVLTTNVAAQQKHTIDLCEELIAKQSELRDLQSFVDSVPALQAKLNANLQDEGKSSDFRKEWSLFQSK